MRAVLIRISTQEILRYNVRYPNKDLIPIESLEADLKWLLINQLDRPTYDSPTEKLERVEEITTESHPDYPELDQFRISFNIVALTPEEQTEYQEAVDDLDASSVKHNKYKSDGIETFDKIYQLIQRRLDKEILTKNQAKNIGTMLYPLIEPLYKGLWILAQVNMDGATPPTNVKLLEIFNKIKTRIDNYTTRNYRVGK